MLLGARKAAAFAALLDAGAGAAAGAAADPTLQRLLGLAGRLQAMPLAPVSASPALRAGLLAAAPSTLIPALPPTAGAAGGLTGGLAGGLGTLGGKAAMGALVIAVAGSGVGVSAHRSLPGDPFYGLKRQVESLQLDLAGGGTRGAAEHLAVAATRLGELAALTGRSPVGPQLLADLDAEVSAWAAQVRAAGTDLLGVPLIERRALLATLDAQERELAALLPRLPAAARALVVRTLVFSAQVSGLLASVAGHSGAGTGSGTGTGSGSGSGTGSGTGTGSGSGSGTGLPGGATLPVVPTASPSSGSGGGSGPSSPGRGSTGPGAPPLGPVPSVPGSLPVSVPPVPPVSVPPVSAPPSALTSPLTSLPVTPPPLPTLTPLSAPTAGNLLP